ncbi:MAG: thioredoxin domain-containing protein [Firmicutes bacterium]|nr:thioredoxin domain-containing protein [Bacillota bacterium]
MKGTGIQWRTWGPEVFEEAARKSKPVLLAIGATWCHWCHVMDRTTYSDPEVARLVEEGFIPVRVDNDRRPEVNRRYNMGGWPTTAFLNAEGAVLTGFTYVPPEQFKRVLRELSDAYARSPEYHHRPYEAGPRHDYGEPAPAAGGVSYEIVKETVAAIEGSFDREHGGFGLQPKFPHAHALDLALEVHARTGNERLLEVVTSTLDNMASGGMYDRVMGGFFRYSTTRDWSVPHFEKMLEDNAHLLRTYAAAYKLTGRQEYRTTAMGILEYLDNTLWRESGGYYGSQDADEGYYALPLEDRRARVAPRVDPAVYANWNAMAASFLIAASRHLDEPALAERAGIVLDTLLEECYAEGKGMRHYSDEGGAKGDGLFEDQIWMCSALLDAHASGAFAAKTGEYLRVARDLLEACLDQYWDEEHGGFHDIAAGLTSGDGAAGALKTRVKSLQDNARAAEVLRRAAFVAGLRTGPEYESWREPAYYLAKAEACLKAFAGSWREYGLIAAPYAAAVLHYLYPVTAEVVGGSDTHAAAEFAGRLSGYFIPGVDVMHGARDGGTAHDGSATPRDSRPAPGGPVDGPAVMVCAGDRCFAPSTSIGEAVETIQAASRLP